MALHSIIIATTLASAAKTVVHRVSRGHRTTSQCRSRSRLMVNHLVPSSTNGLIQTDEAPRLIIAS